ncbi:glycoside hydrolase family 2 [Clostridium sp. 19966]|uniref:glycoside hydrolase family 2 protein n=1 Tax=Clostridium sp. 19966 TaxID=2768166 RepID=UPI0028DF259C|nr:glycoside hydrolase family 2 TIM barrel-domain containing protein [Clostridium sp. 19966]MDT8719291.1 glycoside hydrolase family 2 [Clostridium sp. 19966]
MEDKNSKEDYFLKYQEPCITYDSMIHDRFRDKEMLNGYWNFQIDPYDTFLRADWYKENRKDICQRDLPYDYSFDNWDKVTVPSCWNTADTRFFYYEGTMIYTRTFKYVNRGEGRVYIKFGAANYECRVFLNKKFIGIHKGGSTPFYINVTDFIQGENRLHVVVSNWRRKENVPTDNMDWFNYGGLYRDVELIRVKKTFIKAMRASLAEEGNLKKIRVEINVEGEELSGKAQVRIPILNVQKDFEVANGKGVIEFRAELEPWSPNNPTLYMIEVEYLEDIVKDKVGFREIKVKDGEIYLNGKKIFLRGVCCHEESVENGRCLTEDEVIENIKLAKEMNCNFMRLTHYPHSERVAKLADQLGIMLWEEIAVYWSINFDNPSTVKDAKNQMLELINRDYNRASVIIWGVGNEHEDTDSRFTFMNDLIELTKKQDSTRLISAACLLDEEKQKISDRLSDCIDVISINEYYGWYDRDINHLTELFENSNVNKPVIVTEFGADALCGHRGTVDELFTEECQADVYKKQLEIFRKVKCIKGLSPWILYDFRSPRRTNKYQRGYNLKGLLSADKKCKKMSYNIMKKFYKDIY